MTLANEHCMDLDGQGMRQRLARYLHSQYPSEHREKRLANELDCDPRAAKNLFLGHWPNARIWSAILRRFGRDVLEAVFAPEIEPVLARLTAEEAALERQLDLARARRRQAEGIGSRLAAGMATHQGAIAAEVMTEGRDDAHG